MRRVISLLVPSQPPVGPGQPFLLQAQAMDLDTPVLPLQYLWVQVSGPDTATFDDVTLLEPTVVCDSVGTYTFQLSATNGFSVTSQMISVVISGIYLAAAQYTAFCPSGYSGSSNTVVRDYTSTISLEDAETQAAALAMSDAYSGLVCKENVAPLVNIIDWTPTISATITYTAQCNLPYVGNPVIITYTFTDIGRAYSSIEASAIGVASVQANNAIVCNHGNLAPVIQVKKFIANVTATVTATAQCLEISNSQFGSPSTTVQTLTYQNISYQEAEDLAFETARHVALANLHCISNLGPLVTITGFTPTVTAVVTVAVICPWGNKGSPVLQTLSFTGSDYNVSETTAVQAAYAQANAQLSCVPNIAPDVYIVTQTDLVYRCQVPYRSTNEYRSTVSTSLDFTYIATVTASASCPAGSYGTGAYATMTATSNTDYATAEANATALALAQAQSQLNCSPTPNRIGIRIYNANANITTGSAQVLGVFRLLKGSLAVPQRMKFLGAYTLPTVWQNRFLDNIIYLGQFNDQLSGNWNYVFYFGRPHADGSYVFLPDSVQLRLDNVYPAGAATINSLTGNAPAGILDANSGVLSITSLQSLQYANVSIATAPYLAIDSAGWESPTASFAGVMILQVDSATAPTQVLNYGVITTLSTESSWTEKAVVPVPFTPTFTDWTTPLQFLFFNASTGSGPLGYVLSSGWQVGPPGATTPWQTDYSLVGWTHAAVNGLPAYTPVSYTGTPVLSSSAGSVTLPAATQNGAVFNRTEDVKIILRRYRQKLI